jgi:two-component system OmpR family response regulator
MAAMQDRPHILVVDDDREIRRLLGEYLDKNGYRSTAVPDGKSMRRALEMSAPNLIVLDLMLPGEGGLALCREVRTRSQVPIVMLTALGDEPDRILGFECGADDYVVKPFNPRELLVRIRAVLRRSAHAPRDPDSSEVKAYRFAGWRLDTTTRTLTRPDGSEVALNGAEYRLLSILLSHPSRVLSRIQIMELARGRDLDPFDRSIDVRISRLRQRLGDDARAASIIKTVYGEGYVIGVAVETE